MTDKVQKIREVIEKRYEYWKEKEFNSHSIESEIRMSECQHLLLMVNPLQEEPVSEELDEAADCYKDTVTPEEVDDFEHAYCYETYTEYQIADAFKAGANWKEQQMLSKAVDGYVIEDIEEGNGDFLLSADYLPKSMNLKDQQKVKVIVIKEE